MRYLIFSFLCYFSITNAQLGDVNSELKRAQFKIKVKDTVVGWKQNGNFKINLNQALYSNWQSGQSSNIEINTNVSKRYTYQNKNAVWDNLMVFDYGLSKINGQEIRKTQDRLEINSIVGVQMPENWSYSFFVNLQTPISNTYNYDKDPAKESRIAGVLAPLYVAAGPGIMYRKNSKLFFNLAPVTAKSIYINGDVHKWDSSQNRFVSSDITEIYGVAPDSSTRNKLGMYSSAYFEFELIENVIMQNRMSLYSNYLQNPENIDMDYTVNIIMNINDLLSTTLTFQCRYDDDAFEGIQNRESLGVGLNLTI